MRDAFYIVKRDAVLALSGKILTFVEIIHAIKNYKKKVFQLEIGSNIELIKNSIELKENVLFSLDIKEGLDFLEKIRGERPWSGREFSFERGFQQKYSRMVEMSLLL